MNAEQQILFTVYHTMYIPSVFKQENPEILLKIMQDNTFAILVTTDNSEKPIATQLLFLIKTNDAKNEIKLFSHFAKSNLQCKHLQNNKQILIIFNELHCYISPSCYKNSDVPTFNYVTVQIYGTPKIFTENMQTTDLIGKLSKHRKSFQYLSWKASGNYDKRILNVAFIDFDISVQEPQGKVKIGQNKSTDDLYSIVNSLKKSSSKQEQAIAPLD